MAAVIEDHGLEPGGPGPRDVRAHACDPVGVQIDVDAERVSQPAVNAVPLGVRVALVQDGDVPRVGAHRFQGIHHGHEIGHVVNRHEERVPGQRRRPAGRGELLGKRELPAYLGKFQAGQRQHLQFAEQRPGGTGVGAQHDIDDGQGGGVGAGIGVGGIGRRGDRQHDRADRGHLHACLGGERGRPVRGGDHRDNISRPVLELP